LTALENDHRDDFLIAVVEAGFRSSLVVPLLKDDAVFGVIALGRKQMQPFADKQISLFTDFAAQADIALETTRRERQYREMQSDLTHANRVATMGQLTASIAHEIKQPIATARNNPRAALNFLDKRPPDAAEVREALACIVNDIDRNNEVVTMVTQLADDLPPTMRSGAATTSDIELDRQCRPLDEWRRRRQPGIGYQHRAYRAGWRVRLGAGHRHWAAPGEPAASL
jgi:signal transduction histidine kinase